MAAGTSVSETIRALARRMVLSAPSRTRLREVEEELAAVEAAEEAEDGAGPEWACVVHDVEGGAEFMDAYHPLKSLAPF